MAKKYVKSMKFSQSGEVYYVRDAEAKERLDALEPTVAGKQDALVSGTNIKTINGESVLGSGNIVVGGGSGTTDYNDLSNKPSVNGTILSGNKTASDLGLATSAEMSNKADKASTLAGYGITDAYTKSEAQAKLTPGTNITIVDNVISAASSGTSDYADLSNKPQINSTVLSGNKSAAELGLASTTDLEGKQATLVSGVNIKTINDISILGSGNIEIGGGEPGTGNYNDLSNKPSIGGTTLAGDKTLVELGIASASDLAGKANASDLTDHTSDSDIHVTAAQKLEWSGKQDPATTLAGYGITDAATSSALSGHTSDTNIHVTSEEKLTWSGKQNALNSDQLAAANSGITSSKVSTYDDYASTISGKQDTLVSGTNIKTVNGTSILGTGDLEVEETVTITPNRDEGGFVSGTTYTDLTFQEFAETLLCPYQAPEATITVSPTVCHRGSSNTIAVTLKATKKSKPLTSATWKIGSGSATSVAALVPDGGTSNQSATGISAATTFTFEVQDGKSTITKTASVAFNDYRYHGLVDVAPASVTETIIKGLTTDLTGTKGYTYSSITMTNRRVCYAYPASYGNLSLIKDKNGYDVTSSYTKTTVSVDGVSYNVYTMTDTGSLSNGQMIFS